MKGYKRTIYLNFDYKEVEEGVPDVNRSIAEMNSQFKKQMAAADGTGESIEKLGVKLDKAEASYKLNSDKVKILRKELEELEKNENASAKAITDKTIKLNNAEAEMQKAQNEMKRLNEQIREQKSILGLTSKEWETFGEKTTKIGKDLTLKVTAPLVAMGVGAVKSASDLQEANGKVEAIFGENADQIKAWAEESLEVMGMARSTALEAVATYAGMAESTGQSKTVAMDMSTTLTQLASDMAAYHNQRVDLVQQNLTSVFTGETESLKKYGIVMTQANLQEFAYSQGLRKKISDMTEAEKVQLRYNFVLEKTVKEQGNFLETGGNFANQLQVFAQGVKQLGEEFGEVLLPVLSSILEKINEFINYLSKASDGTKVFVLTIGGIAAAAGPALIVLGSFSKAIVAINGAYVLFAGKAAIANAAMATTGVAGTAGAGGMAAMAGATSLAIPPILLIAGKVLLFVGAVALLTAGIIKLVEAYQKWKSAKDNLGDVSGEQKKVGQNYSYSKMQGFAIGTQYAKGGLARAHEYGDEIIETRHGDRIYTAEQSRQMMSQMGNSGETNSLLSELIGTVKDLKDKVEKLPDRQLMLARE